LALQPFSIANLEALDAHLQSTKNFVQWFKAYIWTQKEFF
jgi:hypothetical protein